MVSVIFSYMIVYEKNKNWQMSDVCAINVKIDLVKITIYLKTTMELHI